MPSQRITRLAAARAFRSRFHDLPSEMITQITDLLDLPDRKKARFVDQKFNDDYLLRLEKHHKDFFVSKNLSARADTIRTLAKLLQYGSSLTKWLKTIRLSFDEYRDALNNANHLRGMGFEDQRLNRQVGLERKFGGRKWFLAFLSNLHEHQNLELVGLDTLVMRNLLNAQADPAPKRPTRTNCLKLTDCSLTASDAMCLLSATFPLSLSLTGQISNMDWLQLFKNMSNTGLENLYLMTVATHPWHTMQGPTWRTKNWMNIRMPEYSISREHITAEGRNNVKCVLKVVVDVLDGITMEEFQDKLDEGEYSDDESEKLEEK